MKIRHNITRTGWTLSGQILETIFAEGEDRLYCNDQYTKNKAFYIWSSFTPKLYKNHLCVHWSCSDNDNNKVSHTYHSEQEAQQALDYINEFRVHNEDQAEPKIEYVYVSDMSVEDAIERKNKRILLAKLPWNPLCPYICVYISEEEKYLKWEEYMHFPCIYAVPVPTDEKKLRQLYLTDAEYEKLTTLLK